jgi:glutathione synthase/RimK-type ligase-like ATP-grasp enzyme
MQEEKVVLILFEGDASKDNPGEFPPIENKYKLCYEHLYTLARNHKARFCRASHLWFNEKNNAFDHAWTFEDGEWTLLSDVVPDVIWDKMSPQKRAFDFKQGLSAIFPILNIPAFTRIANDKYEVARMLPEFIKHSEQVETEKDLQKVIEGIPGDKVVLKPTIGSGGKGVEILSKEEAKNISVEEPMIVQEFIDSSKGIPGIVKGVHDLRLVFVNDELIYSYVRQPAEGSYLANLAQGGSMFIVEPHNLPDTLQPAIRAVQEQFREFPRKIYTIDFMFDEHQRPWIIELNTMPGIYFSSDQSREMNRFYEAIIQVLLETAESKNSA